MAGRTGAAMLEVIIAVSLLAIGGVSAMTYCTQLARSVRQVRAAERELRAASGFLEAVALWPRVDLERRLGEREQGRWRLRIVRASGTIYDVALLDSTGHRDRKSSRLNSSH